MAYRGTDVVLACFAVNSITSFKSVYQTWIYELKYFIPDIPIILVGTKSDLRKDNTLWKVEMTAEEVDNQSAIDMASNIGAVSYLECSAFTQEGLKQVFDFAVMAALSKETKPVTKLCCFF